MTNLADTLTNNNIGNRWTKGNYDRVYLDVKAVRDLINLEVTYYKTGNVSSGALNGEAISNGRTREILGCIRDIWLNAKTGEWEHKQVPADILSLITDAIEAAFTPEPTEAQEEPQEDAMPEARESIFDEPAQIEVTPVVDERDTETRELDERIWQAAAGTTAPGTITDAGALRQQLRESGAEARILAEFSISEGDLLDSLFRSARLGRPALLGNPGDGPDEVFVSVSDHGWEAFFEQHDANVYKDGFSARAEMRHWLALGWAHTTREAAEAEGGSVWSIDPSHMASLINDYVLHR